MESRFGAGSPLQMTFGVLVVLMAVLVGGTARPATAQNGVQDQLSPFGAAKLNVDADVYVWQQQVRANVSGQLEGIEFEFLAGDVGSRIRVAIKEGQGWNLSEPLIETIYSKRSPDPERVFFDLTAADIFLNPGEYYVIELQGSNHLARIAGNYLSTRDGGPLYSEPLLLNEAPFSDGNWRLAFTTYMLPADLNCALSYNGTCPGVVTFGVANATPNGEIWLLWAQRPGSIIVPPRIQCGGFMLNLDSTAQLITSGFADENGNWLVNVNTNGSVCGGWMQAVDMTTCCTTNLERLE